MNTYTFDQIQVGMSEMFQTVVTEDIMTMFREITGDINPLHCSEQYAVSKGYGGRLVYGMLTSSFYSTLVGVFLPGEHCLLHSVETKLLKPVRIGDQLTIRGEVSDKHDVFHTVVIKAVITNQNNERVSKATIQVGVN